MSEEKKVLSIDDLFGTPGEEPKKPAPKPTVQPTPTPVETFEATTQVTESEDTTPAEEKPHPAAHDVVEEKKTPPPASPITPTPQPQTSGDDPFSDLFGTTEPTSISDTFPPVDPFTGLVAPPTAPAPKPIPKQIVDPFTDTTPGAYQAPSEYDFSPAKPGSSYVFMIYGMKGESKTTTAFSWPGTHACLSFDYKSTEIHDTMYKADDRIVVYDAVRYMDYSSPDNWLKSSVTNAKYLYELLDKVIRPNPPDWIVIDGLEEYTRMAEMIMRERNGLSMTQGVEWQFWKERRLYLKQIHVKCQSIARKGIIYTTYPGEKQTIKDGKLVETKDVPKWVDIVQEQTDVLIKVEARKTMDGRRFFAIVESSKYAPIATGIEIDITVPRGATPGTYQRLVEASNT